jgi:hypothetical protein
MHLSSWSEAAYEGDCLDLETNPVQKRIIEQAICT